jgi:glycosyltransferase involved in cell wall biosynthesis
MTCFELMLGQILLWQDRLGVRQFSVDARKNVGDNASEGQLKTISILVPTYNEEDNIYHVYEAVSTVMNSELSHYNWRIVFIDNDSSDNTRALISILSQQDKQHIRAIFNATNFGYLRSHFYGITHAGGDCILLLHADLQNPPALIPEFVKKWEEGSKVVLGIKKSEKENPLMYFGRRVYYALMGKISQTSHIKNFTDFFLLDRDFVKVLEQLDDPIPYVRGIIAELGFSVSEVHYERRIRKHGKVKMGFLAAYDVAMQGITSSSKTLLRSATFVGCVLAVICLVLAVATFINKLLAWDTFAAGSAAIGVGLFFIGAVLFLYLGILGEYILSINQRVLHRPLVIEERRINFSEDD